MNTLHRCLAFFVCLAACASPSGDASVESPASGEAAATCPTEELLFTQANGCMNDGSVEFCLPTGDEDLVARVKEIAPTIQAGSTKGRAGCNVPAETLYFFPTGPAECVAPHGALVDAAWEKLCRIAALPEVKKIVPTWYE